MSGPQSEQPFVVAGSAGAPTKAALRADDVVLRQPGPGSRAVIALLRHFEDVGFGGAPRVVGSGFAADGRETLSYVAGASAHPHAWPDAALFAIGALLSDAHRAARGFALPPGARWADWFGRALTGSRPVIGHCDAGPWNILRGADGSLALIDWELAGPVDALWELAQAVWLNAQLHDDDLADALGLPSARERAGHAALLLDGYGLPRAERAGFVDRLIEFAVRDARAEAVEHAVSQSSTEAVSPSGYPVLWAVTWRTRSAAWILDNRSLIDDALLR